MNIDRGQKSTSDTMKFILADMRMLDELVKLGRNPSVTIID